MLGKGYESVLLKYIDAENLPDFLGGTCTCKHMLGGCVPVINPKEKYISTENNEKVASVYNTQIMNAAMSDEKLCNIIIP